MLTPTTIDGPQATHQTTTGFVSSGANTGSITASTQPQVFPSRALDGNQAVRPYSAGAEAARRTDEERAEPARTPVESFVHDRGVALSRAIFANQVADALNKYRSHPENPDFNHTKSIAGHNNQIPDEAHLALANAVSVPAGLFHAAEGAAGMAGALVPLGTITWSGFLGYVAAPHATAGADTPWAGAGASLGAAMLIAPGSAVSQPAVVPFQEGPRGQAAPSLKGKPKVPNLKHTIASNIEARAETTDANTATFATQLQTWSTAHGTGQIPTDDLDAQLTHLTNLYTALRPEERQQWTELSGIRAEDRAALFDLRNQMAGITTLTNREAGARYIQGLSRFMRGVSGIFNPLILAKTNLSSESVTRIATGIAGLAILSQFPAAAADERFGALKGDRVMALQFADVFNELGKSDWAAGKPVTAAGIDVDKARSNIYRDSALVRADVIVKLAERDLAALVEQHGAIDSLPEGELRTRLETFARDIENLKSTRADIDAPGIDMVKLIEQSENPRNLGYVGSQAMLRLQGGDFAVQLSERTAAVLSMLVFGSGATLAGGRLANAVQGGSDHVPFQRAMGLAGLVGGIALIAAYTVYCSSVIKAHTRDRGDIQFFKQTVLGTFAPVILLYGLMREHGLPLVHEGAMPRLARSVKKDAELVAQADQVLSNALATLPQNLRAGITELGSAGDTSTTILAGSPGRPSVGPLPSPQGHLGKPSSSVPLSTTQHLGRPA